MASTHAMRRHEETMNDVIEALATLEHLVNLSISGQKQRISFDAWLKALAAARAALREAGYDLDELDSRPLDTAAQGTKWSKEN